MFELKSPAGNVHRIVATEQERERLLAEGYVDVTPTLVDDADDANTVTVGGVSDNVIPHQAPEPEETTASTEEETPEPEETTAPVEEIPEVQPPKKAATKKTDKE